MMFINTCELIQSSKTVQFLQSAKDIERLFLRIRFNFLPFEKISRVMDPNASDLNSFAYRRSAR